jgi:hypothetical protein
MQELCYHWLKCNACLAGRLPAAGTVPVSVSHAGMSVTTGEEEMTGTTGGTTTGVAGMTGTGGQAHQVGTATTGTQERWVT